MRGKSFVKNLVDNLDWKEALKHSYSPFHVEGIHYLNLQRSNSLTIKLYFFQSHKIEPVHKELGWLIWPHNHAYNFNTIVLQGGVTDIVYEKSSASRGSYIQTLEHDWLPEIKGNPNGEPNAQPRKDWGGAILNEVSSTYYKSGEGYYHDAADIHTLRIGENTGTTCLLLFQFNDILSPTQMYVAHDHVEPSNDYGCEYGRLTKKKAQSLLGGLNL